MQTWRHAGVCGDSRQMLVRVMAKSGWMCLVGAVGCCWCFHQGLVSSPDPSTQTGPNSGWLQPYSFGMNAGMLVA